MKKATKITLLTILGFLALGFLIYFSVSQSILGSGSGLVELPYFGTISCVQSQTINTLEEYTIPKNGGWISDSFNKNTNAWNVVIDASGLKCPALTGAYVEYYVAYNNDFGRTISGKHQTLPSNYWATGSLINLGSIPSDETVWVQGQCSGVFAGTFGQDGVKVQVTYNPYQLQIDDALRGGRQVINPESCEVPTNTAFWVSRVLSATGLSKSVATWSGSNKLQVGQFYNYISGNVVSVANGNLQGGGYCIYQNGQSTIYGLGEIKLGDGTTLKVVDLDKVLSNPQCCNGFSYPGYVCQSGSLIPVTQAECSTSADCGITEWYTSGDKQASKNVCSSGKCTVQSKTVECTQDSQCPSNAYCDKQSTFKCITTGGSPVTTTNETRTYTGTCGEWDFFFFKTPNYWCLFTNWLNKIILVLSIIFGVIGALIGYSEAKKRFTGKKEKWIPIVLALILGFAVGYVFKLIWFVILGLVLLWLIFGRKF